MLIILIFVSVIVIKAIKRRIEAKQNLYKDYDYGKYENKKIIMKKIKYNIINKSEKNHFKGILSNKDFKTSKEKILF